MSIARIKTVAFEGIDILEIHVANNLPNTLIGFPDRGPAAARNGSAPDLHNLSPADVLKKRSAEIAARVAPL